MFYFIMHCYFVTFFISNNLFHDNTMSLCTFFILTFFIMSLFILLLLCCCCFFLFHDDTICLILVSVILQECLKRICSDLVQKLSWTQEWTDLNWLVILNLRNTFLAITPHFTPMCILIKWQHLLLYYIT